LGGHLRLPHSHQFISPFEICSLASAEDYFGRNKDQTCGVSATSLTVKLPLFKDGVINGVSLFVAAALTLPN